MADPKSQASQQASLLRLLQADAEAQARVQAAHEKARQLVAAAQADAGRLLDDAHTQAQTDAESLVQPALDEAAAAAGALARQTQCTLDEMSQRAAQHTQDAVQFVVDWVTMNGS